MEGALYPLARTHLSTANPRRLTWPPIYLYRIWSEQLASSNADASLYACISLRGMNLGSQSLRALSHDRNNVTGRHDEIVTGALVSNSSSVSMLSLPRTSADPCARSSVGEGEIQLCGGHVDAQAGPAALAKRHQVAVDAVAVAAAAQPPAPSRPPAVVCRHPWISD